MNKIVGAMASLALAVCASIASDAHGQSGATLTPDRRTLLVNKDVEAERWTVSLSLTRADDPSAVTNLTGNVFKSDGSPPSFVFCQVRADSTGSLEDPRSDLRLSCKGTDACGESARDCAREEWRPISDDLPVPAEFFLPAGGLGGSSAAVSPEVAVSLWKRLRRSAERAAARVLGWEVVDRAQAQASDRGATLTLDGLSYLVNKDVEAERWSISLNLVPVEVEGRVEHYLSSVTGNVFKADGTAPSFVYCTEREESAGTLADLESEYRFRCWGADACEGTARACAESGWRLIAEDVLLRAGFFLPETEVPLATDPGIEVLPSGDGSALPGLVVTDFSTSRSASVERSAGVACSPDAACFVRIGTCADVEGRQIATAAGGCRCTVAPIPPHCVVCAGAETGQCGSRCEFAVGDQGASARGLCLPHRATSQECICFPAGTGGLPRVDRCNGPLGAGCDGSHCCADDPSDGCRLESGDRSCSGVCVDASACTGGTCALCDDVEVPPEIEFGAEPERPAPGGKATLAWRSTRASSCEANGGWSGARPVSGSEDVRPDQPSGSEAAVTEYRLSCTGDGGTATASVQVTVAPEELGDCVQPIAQPTPCLCDTGDGRCRAGYNLLNACTFDVRIDSYTLCCGGACVGPVANGTVVPAGAVYTGIGDATDACAAGSAAELRVETSGGVASWSGVCVGL